MSGLAEIELSEEAKIVVEEQFEKLKMIDQSSPEYHVTRSYIQSIIELPWGIYSDDRLDVKKARTILDKDHYGLQDVKTNILEFISTIMKTGERNRVYTLPCRTSRGGKNLYR